MRYAIEALSRGLPYLLMLAALGCGKTELSIYVAPKEDSLVNPSDSEEQILANAFGAAQMMPQHWETLSPTAVRKANFRYLSPDDREASITLSSIPGEAGGLLANVNQWRSEIDMPPIDPEELPVEIEIDTINGYRISRIDLLPDQPEPASPRIVAAVFRHSSLTWFFKITGPSDVVESQLSSFDQFLNTLLKRNSRKSKSAAIPPDKVPLFQAPADWLEREKSPSRHATYAIVKDNLPTATFSIVKHQGDPGSLLNNVNRWRRQLKLKPWSLAAYEKNLVAITTPEAEFNLFDLRADATETSAPNLRMLAAQTVIDGDSWVFRIVGDPFLIETQRDQFRQLLFDVSFGPPPIDPPPAASGDAL